MAQADVAAAMYSATTPPVPNVSQTTKTRAAGATKNAAVTTSTADNAVEKQKIPVSTAGNHGAMHEPDTV